MPLLFIVMLIQAKLSKQGQVTIPKKVIKKYNLELECLLNMELLNDKIVISRRTNPLLKYNGLLKNKISITTQDFLKIRKNQSKLI